MNRTSSRQSETQKLLSVQFTMVSFQSMNNIYIKDPGSVEILIIDVNCNE